MQILFRLSTVLMFLLFSVCATAQNDTKIFKDKEGIYEIQLPASWKSIKARMTTQFTIEDPENRKRQLTLEKIRLYDENTSLTTEKLALNLASALKSDGQKKLLDSKFVTIDGMKWFYIYYTSNGLRFKSYNIVYNVVRYAFYYIAPENDYLAGEPAASASVASFRFLNKPATAAADIVDTKKNDTPSTPVNSPAPPKKEIAKPATQSDKPVVSEAKLPVAATAPVSAVTVPKEKFMCDTAHKPYKYYGITWEGAPTAKSKTGISIYGKLSAGTKLNALSFIDNKLVSITTGTTRHIDDEGMSFDYTNIYGFPDALDKKHQAGPEAGLFAIQNTKPLDFSLTNTVTTADDKLKATFTAQITAMINSPKFINAHKIKAEYYQKEFNNAIRTPLNSIRQVLIPGVDCYLIVLKDEYDRALFISINGLMYMLSADYRLPMNYTATFYKMNDNYFLLLKTGCQYNVYEIRNTGIKDEWHYDPGIETSNFGDAPELREQAKRMRFISY